MKVIEEYKIKWINEVFTIRLLSNGEHRCSCKKFKKQSYITDYCYHIKMYYEGKLEMLELRRFM